MAALRLRTVVASCSVAPTLRCIVFVAAPCPRRSYRSHYGKWLQDLGTRVSEAGTDLSEAIGRKRDDLTAMKTWLVEAIDERVRSLQEGLTAVGETYHPFCRQLIEYIRARFHLEAEAVLAQA